MSATKSRSTGPMARMEKEARRMEPAGPNQNQATDHYHSTLVDQDGNPRIEYGGFADVARVLTDLSHVRGKNDVISRQGVFMWWTRRDRNGFPERQTVVDRRGRERRVFKISEVVNWHATYTPSGGGWPAHRS